MTTLVRFRASTGEYALPVEHVTEVRSAADLTPLPAPREGVAGLMRRGDDAVTVLSVLGTSGDHVIVLHQGDLTFGLLVSQVTGVQALTDEQIGPPPPGQDRAAVSGVVNDEDHLVLVLDCAALAGRLA